MAGRFLEVTRNNAAFIGLLPRQTAGLVATEFDGTSDKVEIAPAVSGLANGPTLILSFWSWRPTGSSNFQLLTANSGSFLFDFTPQVSLNRTFMRVTNTTPATYDATFVSGYAADTWNHFAASYNTATGKRERCLNGVFTSDTSGPTGVDLSFAAATLALSAQTLGGTKARLSEIYIGTGDVDLAASITRLRSASGKPVDLGPDGSRLTGSAPEIYAATGNMAQNTGTGGNGTVTGAPITVAGPGA